MDKGKKEIVTERKKEGRKEEKERKKKKLYRWRTKASKQKACTGERKNTDLCTSYLTMRE